MAVGGWQSAGGQTSQVSQTREVSGSQALLRVEAWLETMRGPQGYGGPVAHWWQNCLHFTGAGLDWRYEGIVVGYLQLYGATGDGRWLAKAGRAGDDLLQGQLESGNYRASSFELNPYPGGTPHEAACDMALLSLAAVLRAQGDPQWQTYLKPAERNLRGYYLGLLWDEGAQAFRDHPHIPSFVPNKAATLVEALCLYAALTCEDSWLELYARPTLEAVLRHQVREGALDGAIHQYSQHGQMVAKFFPYYIARCVPGLVAGYRALGEERWLEAAQRAMAFVLRWRYDDGSFPQVVYPDGRVNRYPQWVAAVGDILRAMELLRPYGLDADPGPTVEWLCRGLEPTGGLRTAYGFGSQISQRPPGPLPEFRDLLPVCGWVDKGWRYLAESRQQTAGSGWRLAGGRIQDAGYGMQDAGYGRQDTGYRIQDGGCRAEAGADDALASDCSARISAYEAECTWRGRGCLYCEDGEVIELRRGGEVLYRWRKGAPWAEVCAAEMGWK